MGKSKQKRHTTVILEYILYVSYRIHTEITKCKDLLFGKQRVCIPFENEGYIATFIIPKGAIYIINAQGEVVSDKIMYTGKYIKL